MQQILKQKECIQERVNSGTLRLNAQIKVNLSKYPEIEHRCKPLPVSGALLQARALHQAKLRNTTEFKASRIVSELEKTKLDRSNVKMSEG